MMSLAKTGEFSSPNIALLPMNCGGAKIAISDCGHSTLLLSRLDTIRIAERHPAMPKRDGGIFILEDGALEAAKSLLEQLAEYGLFVVPGGELKCWLKHLGSTGHGPSWLINMFKKMGEDPASSGYEVPSDEDVWAFVACVRDWLTDSQKSVRSSATRPEVAPAAARYPRRAGRIC